MAKTVLDSKLLSDDQISQIGEMINSVLELTTTVPTKVVYANFKNDLGGMEQHVFARSLSFALKEGRIQGLGTRRGKGGGICKIENASKPSISDDILAEEKCLLTIENTSYKINMAPELAAKLLVKVFGATQDDEGEVTINFDKFILVKEYYQLVEDYILNMLDDTEIINSSLEKTG